MNNPWMKFYPSDWRSDPRLRMCSLAARGLWIEMLAIMHEATPYGHLLISGISPTDAQLAVLAGAPSDQLPALLVELEAAGVFSRTRSGVIYSRRMTRDEKKSALAREMGKKGGNPSLSKDNENPPSDNPPHKGRDKTQKPEARSQIPERKESPLPPAGAAAEIRTTEQPFEHPDRTADQDRFPEFWAAFPLKQNQTKAQAEFMAACITTAADQIIAGAKAYAAARAGQDPRYTTQPASWLRDKRWTDETPAAPKQLTDRQRRFQRIAARYP